MKKILSILALMLVSLCLAGCRVTGGSGSGLTLPVHVQLSVDRRTVPAEGETTVHLHYGHRYTEGYSDEHLLRHVIVVYALPGDLSGDPAHAEGYPFYYEMAYEGSDIASEDYREFDVDILVDFSALDYQIGVLIARIGEVMLVTREVDGQLVEVEITKYATSELYFRTDGSTITFSNRGYSWRTTENE